MKDFSEARWMKVDPSLFWAKLPTRATDQCWEWQGSRRHDGYGEFFNRPNKLRIRAHRMSWLLTHGQIPEGLVVCHTCDNPPCCNPAHLWLGTKAVNQRDMALKGRSVSGEEHWTKHEPEKLARGARHGMATLTDEQVAEMRRLHDEEGRSQLSLAKQFGVHRETAHRIIRRKTWG